MHELHNEMLASDLEIVMSSRHSAFLLNILYGRTWVPFGLAN